MARGNVALAAVFNAVNTALSPFIVPLLFFIADRYTTGGSSRLDCPRIDIVRAHSYHNGCELAYRVSEILCKV